MNADAAPVELPPQQFDKRDGQQREKKAAAFGCAQSYIFGVALDKGRV